MMFVSVVFANGVGLMTCVVYMLVIYIYSYTYDVERFEVGKRRRNTSPYFVWVEKWSRVEGRRVEKHTLSKWK